MDALAEKRDKLGEVRAGEKGFWEKVLKVRYCGDHAESIILL